MSSQLEKENLEAHVDLCAEIKAMISLGQSNQFRMLLSAAGGIITVLLAVLGYLFIKLV